MCTFVYKDIIINVVECVECCECLECVQSVGYVAIMCVWGDYGIFLFTVNICMQAREMKIDEQCL